jgi:hypothetical protein
MLPAVLLEDLLHIIYAHTTIMRVPIITVAMIMIVVFLSLSV